MFDSISNYLTILQSNPVMFSIFGTTIIGWLLYICKDLPVRFLNFVLDLVTLRVEVHQSSDEEAFNCIEEELKNNKLYYITGKFQIIHEWMLKKISLSCGEHNKFITRMNNKWVMVEKITDGNVKFWHSTSYKLRFFSKDMNGLNVFIDSLLSKRDCSCAPESIKVFKWSGTYWSHFMKRKLETSCFFSFKKDYIIKQVCFFLNNEEMYLRKNKPRRLGILLHGLPGCGKTHFVHMLASILELNIYYINPQEFNNDADFIKAIMTTKNPSILLFEDIDCNENFHDREKLSSKKAIIKNLKEIDNDDDTKKVNNGISMSTLLNVFDGLLAQEEQIIVATTNHIERLDPALIRAGRFDIKMCFDKLEKKYICEFVCNWFEAPPISKDLIPENMFISISELSKICAESQNINDCIEKLKCVELD